MPSRPKALAPTIAPVAIGVALAIFGVIQLGQGSKSGAAFMGGGTVLVVLGSFVWGLKNRNGEAPEAGRDRDTPPPKT